MLRHALLAIILLELPLQVDKYFLHQDDIATFGTIGGFNFSITTICLFILYLQWIPNLVGRSRFPGQESLKVSLPLMLYLVVVAASMAGAYSRLLSLFELTLLMQAFFLYLYVANTVRSRTDILFIVTVLLIGLAFQGILMIIVYLINDDIYLGPIEVAIRSTDGRVAGTLGSVIPAASYLALLIPTAVSVLLVPARRSLKLLACCGLALSLVGLLLTQSRGAWFATLFATSVLLFLVWHRGWMSIKMTVAVGSIGFFCLLAFQGLIIERIFGDDENSAESRLTLGEMALEVIGDRPLLGVGANNGATAMLPYSNRAGFRGEWFYTVHSKYLLTWLETGLLGLVMFASFLFHTIYVAWQAAQRTDPLLATLAIGLGAAVAGQMIHMGFDVYNSRPQVQMLWLVAGVITALRWTEDPS